MEQGKAPMGTISTDARTSEGVLVVQPGDTDTRMERFDERDLSKFKRDEFGDDDVETKITPEESKLRRELGIKIKGPIFTKVKSALAPLLDNIQNEDKFLKKYEEALYTVLQPTIARILDDLSLIHI